MSAAGSTGPVRGGSLPSPAPTRAAVREFLAGLRLDPEAREYARVHERRYVRALEIVGRLLDRRRAALPAGHEPILCDVAPHLLSVLFRRFLGVPVNTVGAPFPGGDAEAPHGHMDYDLNRAHRQEGWQGFVRHDVVYMGEILEHLHASPRFVIGCASRWVKDGGFLVVQTPNAVALSRRLTMLRGRNPYEMIRDGDDPGHFREYTAPELRLMGKYWQLETEDVRYDNYFDLGNRGPVRAAAYRLGTLWPKTLRDGLTVVFRKPEGVPDPGAPSRLLRGHVDLLEIAGGVVTVAGWAVDLGLPGPCPLVDLVFDGVTFNGTVPSFHRSDVVAALGGDPRLLRCGFHIACPAPPGFDPARLAVRCRDVYGDVLLLERAPGAPRG